MSSTGDDARWLLRAGAACALRLPALLAAGAFAVLLAAPARAQVVISQLYGGGGNVYARDYVELFNRGAEPIALDGLSLQYASATGTGLFASNGITPLAGSLAPGAYLLVGLAQAASGSPLPAPFLAGSGSTNLSATSGKLALVAGTTGLACNGGSTPCDPSQRDAILDLVGYGAADFHEGAWAAPAASTATALHRAGAGCVDGDTNGADFTTGAPLPRTGATTPAPCPLGPGLPTVALSLDAEIARESEATTVTLSVTASAPVEGEQSVALDVGGPGLTAADYVLSSARVTLVDGATSGAALFSVVDDALVEGTEIATLALVDPSEGLALGTTTSRSLVILDDEGCAGPATAIHAVQGAGLGSPLQGGIVTVEAIVTGLFRGTAADSLQGFFLQEEDADADLDSATSEGLFVLEGNGGLATGLALGDRVRATGVVAEASGRTQLGPLLAVERCAAGEPLPTAAGIALPVPDVPAGDLAAARAAIDAYYEAFEGMRVVIPTTLAVAESFDLERFGTLRLVAGGRIPIFTDVHPPSPSGWIAHQIEVARRTLLLDDGDDTQNGARLNGRPLPYPMPGLSVSNRLRSGDELRGLTALLDTSSAGASEPPAWRLRPVADVMPIVFAPANPRPATPPPVPGTFRFASLNVLNYFTTIDTTPSSSSGVCGPSGTLDCRGADSAAELARQTAKLVAALCALEADVVALVELENDAFATASALVAATNAVSGCGPYAFVNTGPIGTDAIKVGLLYRTTTASPVGPHAILDATVDPRFLDTRNRPVLAQTFLEPATGERLTVAVAHLKSKGSACSGAGDADAGDGQGVCNETRTRAAEALVDWLAGDPTGSADPDFLIVGDLNSYAREDPIAAILAGADDAPATGDDWVDLLAAGAASSAAADAGGTPATYTYLFEGRTGRLDHALASAPLAARVAGASVWHINADEPPVFDYDDAVVDAGEVFFEAKPGALPLYAPDPFRSADHDPVLIGLPEPGGGGLVGAGGVGLAALAALARRRRSDGCGHRRPVGDRDATRAGHGLGGGRRRGLCWPRRMSARPAIAARTARSGSRVRPSHERGSIPCRPPPRSASDSPIR